MQVGTYSKTLQYHDVLLNLTSPALPSPFTLLFLNCRGTTSADDALTDGLCFPEKIDKDWMTHPNEKNGKVGRYVGKESSCQ
jgi:hypothetical protein